MSISSMKVPRQTATSGAHLRIAHSVRSRPARRAGSRKTFTPERSLPPAIEPRLLESSIGGRVSEESIILDELDHQLLHALTLDARVPFARFAQLVDVSEQTVARRFRRLRAAGV